MNVVDSSCWLEYFADGPNAREFGGPIGDLGHLLVPTIVLLEVFKNFLRTRDLQSAHQAAAIMSRGQIVDMDAMVALSAAQISLELKLPLADSVILATARKFGATLWTQDAHFEGIEHVKFVPVRSAQ
jgi:predicted nucleic acid-binding protein